MSEKSNKDDFNLTHEELAIIDKVAKRLARRFKFGYYEVADIEQQARLIALEGLKRYDGVRPLENYLWVHVRNRLCNFKRDNFMRPHGPCKKCDFYQGANSGSVDGDFCEEYKNIDDCLILQQWRAKNTVKLNLIYPIEFACVDDYHENGMHDSIITEDQVFSNELETILDRHIPVEHRHNYLRLRYGYKVSSQYKIPLVNLIREIVEKHYITNKSEIQNG